MLQNPCKTLGFKKNMVYKIPPGGGGKPYPASGLYGLLDDVCKHQLLWFFLGLEWHNYGIQYIFVYYCITQV